jgi:hypothetical protein
MSPTRRKTRVLPDLGPGTFPAMTYDSLRRQVVLFPGQPSSVSAKPEEKYLDDRNGIRMNRSIVLVLTCVSLFAMVHNMSGQESSNKYEGLDHIIISVPNLEHGMALFTELTGVAPMRGGQHPGLNTENALVSLGAGRYLELLAPINSGGDVPAVDLNLRGWAVHTKALPDVLQRLTAAGFELTSPRPGSRRTRDGALLEWQTADLRDPHLTLAPFIIQWSATTPHPSRTNPRGCELVSIDLESPDPTRLSGFLKVFGYQGEVLKSTKPRIQVILSCPKGRLELISKDQ